MMTSKCDACASGQRLSLLDSNDIYLQCTCSGCHRDATPDLQEHFDDVILVVTQCRYVSGEQKYAVNVGDHN